MAKDLELKKSSDIALFKPTALMEKFVDTAVDNLGESQAEICRLTGMDESTFYKWRKQDGFEAWFNDQYDARLHRIKPLLDAAGLKFALRGQHDFWKDMQKIAGRDLDSKTPQTAVQVNFNQVTDNDMEEFSE